MFDCLSFIDYIKWNNYKIRDIKRYNYDYIWHNNNSTWVNKQLSKWDVILFAIKCEKPSIWEKIWLDSPYIFLRKDINSSFQIVNSLHHFAIYLWEWLYMSKFWEYENIVITDYENLYKIYPYNDLFKVTDKIK